MDDQVLAAAGTAAALLSALALYGASRHCLWTRLHVRLRRGGAWAGLMLAAVSLAAWVGALGAGAGLCVMLAVWMIGLVAFPYLGWATHAPDTYDRRTR